MAAADRPTVSRERTLAAAIALADEQGLAAVSMRQVAARLDVVPMALYKHVANKEDLLDGMVETVVAGYEQPAPGGSWPDRVRARVLAARAELVRHPWLRHAIESRTSRTPAVLSHMDAVTGELIDGGLSVDLAHHVMHALGHRIWGFSPEAFDEPGGDTPSPEALDAFARTFPHIVAVVRETTRDGGRCDADLEFDFALDLLLDGVERLHASGWRSRR